MRARQHFGVTAVVSALTAFALPAHAQHRGHVRCCDGTRSATCTEDREGCCSRHGGVCEGGGRGALDGPLTPAERDMSERLVVHPACAQCCSGVPWGPRHSRCLIGCEFLGALSPADRRTSLQAMCQIVGPNDAIASILGVPAVSGPPPTQVPAVVAVMSAIWAVHESALACPRDGSAPVRATVTFARAGRVSAVAFTPSRRRSREAECISRALRAATVPAFLNDSYVVTYELPAAGVADGGTVAGAGTLTVPWTGERTRFEDSGAVIHETITLPLQPTLRREFEGPDMAEVRSQLRAAVVPCLPDPSSIASVDVVFDSAGRVTRQSVSTSTAYRECIEHGLASLHFTVAPFAAPYCRVQENFRGAGAERPIVTSNLREEPHSTAAPPTAPAPRVLTQEDLDGMRRELRRLAEGLTTCGTAFDNPSGALVLTVSPDGTVARAGFRTMNPIAEEGIRCATTIARTWTFAPFPGPAVQLSTVILLPRRRE